MGLRFQKRIKIAPGVTVNLNKKSTGISIGPKGAHYTVNSSGKRTASVGIPGTGIYYTESVNGKKGNATRNTVAQPMQEKISWYKKTGWIITLLILFWPAGIYLMWKHANWKKSIKMIITALFFAGAISLLI